MNRRAFLSRFLKGAAATAAIALVVPDELFTPEPIRTYFLPPAGGWNANHYWGVDWAKGPDHTGISLRMVREYDIKTDRFPCRMDVFMSTAVIRPELSGFVTVDDDEYAPFEKEAVRAAAKRLADHIDLQVMEQFAKDIAATPERLFRGASRVGKSDGLAFHKDAFSLVTP